MDLPHLTRRTRGLAIVSLAAFAAGCAVTSVEGERMRPGSDAFAAYVETVFRQQNEIATSLAFEIDDEDADSPRYLELESAETELDAACRGLNELARRRRDGEPLGGLGALRRAREAPACEQAATTAESLL